MEQKLFTRNFVLLILGQASSLFGNYLLRLALSMFVLEITGSAAVFAGILSTAMVPSILLSPFGGILADRADRRKIMVALDILTGTAVFCGAVCLTRENAPAGICLLLVVLSVLAAFETPTVQACIPQMLPEDQLVRGNAVVNQVASVSCLIAPMLGGVLYGAVGLKPVMWMSIICFFLTALLECFIDLCSQTGSRTRVCPGKLLSVVKEDFVTSIRFITGECPKILGLLVLVAVSRFFVMGVTLVGLPFLVRTVLGLGAVYYGGAESMLAVASVLGSIAAGLFPGDGKEVRLYRILGAMGICMIPAGAAFLFPWRPVVLYTVLVASLGSMQAAISIFSVFALARIQQHTPKELTGKVMAYTSTITLCAQPAGQVVYGLLFDRFREAAALVLIFSGVAVCLPGLLGRRSEGT